MPALHAIRTSLDDQQANTTTAPSSHRNKGIIIWLATGCFLIFVMVLVGGMTRLTQSGLSMVDWDLIMGSVPPLSDADWQQEFAKYQQSPEFTELNYDFSLNDFKSIFWWEYIHRMLGRLIGLVFIVPFFWFIAKKRIDKALMPKLVIILALGAFQGFLGWFMVKSGLKDIPHVSHYRLAAHLITAFLTFGYTFWVALSLFFGDAATHYTLPKLRRLANILFGTVVLQIIYGAFVAGLKAGVYYPTWPKMGDKWFPPGITGMEPLMANFVEGIAGVQFLHRYIAYVVAVLVVIIWWKARNLRLQYSQRYAVNALAVLMLIQFYLGVMTLLKGVPIYLGIAHQAGAFLLFGATVFAMHRLGWRPASADAAK